MRRDPAISVVMGVYNGARLLTETIASVLGQTETDLECVIVNDGSTDPAVGSLLLQYARQEPRIRIVTKANEGLTRALIDGCRTAKGIYIARIDNGDAMLPERLAKQKAVLDQHPDAVLATCWTESCGPLWEPLYTTRNILPEEMQHAYIWELAFPENGDDRDRLLGPTSHPSVMMRTDAYRKAGGYRVEFYYGQDWDLWYRLAEIGKFAGVQEVLYRCRIFPDGISMGNAERQRRIHACSRGAFRAKRRGEDDVLFLERAAAIRPGVIGGQGNARIPPEQRLAAGCYFIGEALRRNRDRRCRNYYAKAFCLSPWRLKIGLRWMQSFFQKA